MNEWIEAADRPVGKTRADCQGALFSIERARPLAATEIDFYSGKSIDVANKGSGHASALVRQTLFSICKYAAGTGNAPLPGECCVTPKFGLAQKHFHRGQVVLCNSTYRPEQK